jgi:Uma2 family endonuclease
MSAATMPVPTPTLSARQYPRRRVWTCDDLYRLREWRDVWFGGNRLYLIDGEILEMPPPGPPHSMSVALLDYWCKSVFGSGYVVRVQDALPLGINTDPLPDVAVVVGQPRDFTAHPTTAELVVEVADSSLATDTGYKANLYAAAGIKDYWVIDVDHRRLFVFRDPRPDPAAAYGHAYFHQITLGPTDAIAPLAAPHAQVTVADLLP